LTGYRPLLIVEVLRPARLDILETQRRELGFVDIRLQPETAVVGAPVVFDLIAWNHVWVPPEALDPFLGTLRGLGIAITA
jgi:hypothetical protein